jgi:glycolate oxidase iron-sulfur subunit
MDISEFLAGHLNIAPRGEIHLRVTYSDSCHLRHAQKISRQPRDLLHMIPGLELVELEKPDRCCGSAGVYNIQQWQTAETVLDAKMADIDGTDAEVVVVANTGCYMQHVYGAQRSRNHPRVAHLVELLEESYANAPF